MSRMKDVTEIGQHRYRVRYTAGNIVIERQLRGEKATWGDARYFTKWPALRRALRDMALAEAAEGLGVVDLLDGVKAIEASLQRIEQQLSDWAAEALPE